MFGNNFLQLSPIPEEEVSPRSPCNALMQIRKNYDSKDDSPDQSETDISTRSEGEPGEDVEASEENVEASEEDVEATEDVEASAEDEGTFGEDGEHTASESVAETTDGSSNAGNSSSPKEVQTPDAMRRQRKSRLTDIIPFVRSAEEVLKDFTPPAGSLAMDVSGASLSSPHEGPAATSSPRQRFSASSQEPYSPLPELIIEVEKKYSGRDSDSEDFFNRLEKTMGKLYRKYILKEEDDTWSFDSGVQKFESAYLDDYFDERNEGNGREPRLSAGRVVSDSLAKRTDVSGKIDHTGSSEAETPEAIRPQSSRQCDVPLEMSKRSVLKDLTLPTRGLTMQRIAGEEIMNTLHDDEEGDDYSDEHDHGDRDALMHSLYVLEEEESNDDETPEQAMEHNGLESLQEETGEPEDEEDYDEEVPEGELERGESESLAKVRDFPIETEEEDNNDEQEKVQNALESFTEASDADMSMHSPGELDEEYNNGEELEEEVAQSASVGAEESTGKHEGEEEEEEKDEDAEASQEVVERMASESRVETTDAHEGPEILSSPDLRLPEAVRRRRSSKATIISPVESKYSKLKNLTPPTGILTVQRITDEWLLQTDEHIGEEEAAINEEAQEEEEEQTAVELLAGISDASNVGQRRSRFDVISTKRIYLESSEQTCSAQKMKGLHISESSSKRARLSGSLHKKGQGKATTDLDEIVPFSPNGERTENRKQSAGTFTSPVSVMSPTLNLPTQETVSPVLPTPRSFITRRKPTRLRTDPATQSCSPLPELNIEIERKYLKADSDSDSEEFFNRLEKTMKMLYRKYILKVEDDTESIDSWVQKFENLLYDSDDLDSDDDND